MKFGMRRLVALAATLAAAAAGSACGDVPGNPPPAPAARAQQTRAPGEYLVTLAARGNVEAIAELYGQFGIKSVRDLGRNVFLLTLTEDPGPARMEALRGENAHIQAVQPNFVYGTRGPGLVQ